MTTKLNTSLRVFVSDENITESKIQDGTKEAQIDSFVQSVFSEIQRTEGPEIFKSSHHISMHKSQDNLSVIMDGREVQLGLKIGNDLPFKEGLELSVISREERDSIEMVKQRAKDPNKNISRDIQEYGIQDQLALIEIAKLAAKQDGGGCSRYIQNYGIKDQDALIQIAKIAAQQDGCGCSEYIQNYGIKDQAALIDIAKIAAEQGAWGHSRYIQNYGIQDQTALIDIAKIAAKKNGLECSENIENYRIQDQDALIDIAKIAAKKNGYGCSEFIQKYGIQDQDALIDIAKLAAEQGGWGYSIYIQNYGIQDQTALIDIAKIAAQHNGGGCSEYIQNYGIKDQAALIDIAKIAVKKDEDGCSRYIQNYGIKDQDALIQIAKIAAEQGGCVCSRFIRNYGIQDQDALIQIAKIAAQQNGEGCSGEFQNYGIKDPEELINILSIAIAYGDNPEKIYSNMLQKTLLSKDMVNSYLEKSEIPQVLKEDLAKQQDPIIEIILKAYLIRFTAICKSEIYRETSNQELLKKSLESIYYFRDPKLRFIVSDILMNDLVPTHLAFYESLYQSISGKDNPSFTVLAKDNPSFTVLAKDNPSFTVLAALSARLVNKGIDEQKIRNFFDLALKNRRISNDLVKIHTFIQLCKEWSHSPNLEGSDIEYLMDRLLSVKGNLKEKTLTVMRESHSILGILLCKQPMLLKKESVINHPSLSSLFAESFKNACGISKMNLEGKDFSELYKETIGKFRSPESLLIYAGKLQALPTPDRENSLVVFTDYIQSVLLGKFKEERYDETKSPQLTALFSKGNTLKSKWMAGASQDLELTPVGSEGVEKKKIDYFSYCNNVIITHKHLPLDDFEQLKDYLELTTPTPDEVDTKLKALQKQIKEAPSKEKPKYSFQYNLIKLCSKTTNEKEILQSLSDDLRKVQPDCGFLNIDLPHLLQNLNETKVIDGNFKLVDSDDPCDLLMMGTEVSGSCQRVDGDPHRNKGLLGYIMNGENRVFALKNNQGKIVMRCLARLMIDEKKNPVLFTERLYPSPGDPKHEAALNAFIKQRAKELELPLPKEGVTLSSLGGRAPFQYVDSAGGIQKGPFTI